MNRRFCFALDLKSDPALIAEYKKYHEKIWPKIAQGLKDSGIEDLEIEQLMWKFQHISAIERRES